MSILGVAIVPPHLVYQLLMRMAVAFYVTGISTSEVHLESPPLLGTLTRVQHHVLKVDVELDYRGFTRPR
jgi:hypothetical protein